MDTLVLDAAAPDAVERAAALLAAGELVALPTETVYGLAADAAQPAALAAIFQAKERPLFDPLIVHLPDRGWLDRLTVLPRGGPALLERIADAFWPGPLTVVLPRRVDAVPDLVTAGGPLVAVRISAHPVFRAVVERFGRPIAAPSANRFGRISPTTGAHVYDELRGRVALILEAGATEHGLESTVVALGEGGESVRILRHGPVTAEALANFAQVETLPPATDAAARAAPGQTSGHYAPRTPLVFPRPVQRPPAAKTGFLAFRRDRSDDLRGYAAVEYLSADGDLREAAARLFAALRRLDGAGMDLIVAEPVPEEGLGRAITERLRRAAAGSGAV